MLSVDIVGSRKKLEEILKADDGVLIVSYIYCPFCVFALPLIFQHLADTFKKNRNVYLLRITPQNEKDFEDFLNKYQIVAYPTLLDIKSGKVVNVIEGVDEDGDPQKTIKIYENLIGIEKYEDTD